MKSAELEKRIATIAREMETMSPRAIEVLGAALRRQYDSAKTPRERERAESMLWLCDQAISRARVRA